MKTIKLTEEQIKGFDKSNLYLDAVFGSNGIMWEMGLSTDYVDIDELYGPIPVKEGRQQDMPDGNDPGMVILNNIVYEFVDNLISNIGDYLYCDECNGTGTLVAIYNPENKTLTFNLEVHVNVANEEEHFFAFSDLINAQPAWLGGTYYELKKLQYDEFINKYKSELGNIVEIPYDGGGDEGQINGDLPTEIEHLAYEIIDIYYSGWENNEGADGIITINFDEKTVRLIHIGYYGDSETETIDTIEIV